MCKIERKSGLEDSEHQIWCIFLPRITSIIMISWSRMPTKSGDLHFKFLPGGILPGKVYIWKLFDKDIEAEAMIGRPGLEPIPQRFLLSKTRELWLA